MRLVEETVSTLDEQETKKLLDLVLSSKKADEKLFRKMETWHKFVKGEQWPEEAGLGKENRVTINLAFAFVRAMIPTLFFREPTIDATPMHPAHEGKEETWELVTNNSLPRVNFAAETTKELFDAVIFSEGWSKIAYNKGDDDPESGDDRGAGTLTEGLPGPTAWATMELPLWLRQPAYRVIVDRLAPGRDPEHARFIAIEYLRPIEELKADPRYTIPKDFDEKKLMPFDSGMEIEEQERMGIADFVGAPEHSGKVKDGLVRFWEVWVYQLVEQKLYKQMVVIADGANKPIRQPIEWSEFVGRKVKGWPLERLILNYMPDDCPLSDLEPWAGIQLMFNWAMSMIVNQLGSQVDIIAMDNNGVKNPEAARKKILAGESVVIVEVDNLGAIERIGRSPVSGDAYNVVGLLERFAEKVGGISGQRMGESRNVRTATEASVVETGQQIVTDYKVDLVAKFLKRKIIKWQAVLRDTIPDGVDFALRTAGNTGFIDWKTFSAEDLDWQPEINIQVNSFRDADKQQEMHKWGLALNMMMQMAPVLTNPDFDETFGQFLKGIGIESPGQIVGNSGDQQILQMSEIVNIIAQGIEDLPVNVSDNNDIHIQIIDAIIQYEGLWNSIPADAQTQVLNHRTAHVVAKQQQLQQFQGMGGNGRPTTSTPNPFGTGNPANEARQRTAEERSAVEPGFGAGGQFQ